MLGMLTFGVIIVIHRSNYLSESQTEQSYQSQYSLYNVDTMKHTIGGKMAQGVPFCPRVGAKWSSSIFFIFSIFQEYNYICLHFLIEYMSCRCRKIPAKYHDNFCDIFNVGSVVP